MKPPQLQSGKSGDVEFFILCHKMIEVIGMVNACGILFIGLQLYGCARKSWNNFERSRQFGSPLVEWDVFSGSFRDRFIQWRGDLSKV